MGITDEIRKFVCKNYIQPARERGENEITIRAGNVHEAKGLVDRMPAVCSALKTKIDDICNVKILKIEAPPKGAGANFYVTYKILKEDFKTSNIKEDYGYSISDHKIEDKSENVQEKTNELFKLKQQGTINISIDTLFIIPCSAEKVDSGILLDKHRDIISSFVSSKTYNSIVSAREDLIKILRTKSRYMTSKNREIKDGPDFGLNGLLGKYLPAIERYKGKLYTAIPNFSKSITAILNKPDKPKILILSALYGPLHPLDMIQNYNLKMSDSPAFRTWKVYFPSFLEEYVKQNTIKDVYLYLGGSTAYLKVAKESVNPLLKRGILNQAIQFEVENGDSYNTPHNHGLLIAEHLGNISRSNYTRRITAISLRDNLVLTVRSNCNNVGETRFLKPKITKNHEKSGTSLPHLYTSEQSVKQTNNSTVPVYKLILHATYYKNGFFNVITAYDRYVGEDLATIDMSIDDTGQIIRGHINRTANNNKTARIMGGQELKNWFQANFNIKDTVNIEFISPVSIRLRKNN